MPSKYLDKWRLKEKIQGGRNGRKGKYILCLLSILNIYQVIESPGRFLSSSQQEIFLESNFKKI